MTRREVRFILYLVCFVIISLVHTLLEHLSEVVSNLYLWMLIVFCLILFGLYKKYRDEAQERRGKEILISSLETVLEETKAKNKKQNTRIRLLIDKVKTLSTVESEYNSIKAKHIKLTNNHEIIQKKIKESIDFRERLNQELRTSNRKIEQLKKYEHDHKTVEVLKNQLQICKNNIRALENQYKKANKKLIQQHQANISKLQTRYEILEKNFNTKLNNQIMTMVNKPVLIPRFIHQMYKQGFKDQQTKQEELRRTEIILDIQEATINQKEIQILTREEKIKLDVERNNWNIEKAHYQLDQRINNFIQEQKQWKFSQEKKEYQFTQQKDKHERVVERYNFTQIQDAFAHEKKIALFDLEQREKDIQRTIDRYEIQQLEDKLNAQQRENMHKLKVERENLAIDRKKILHEFDVREKNIQEAIKEAKDDIEKRATLLNYQEKELSLVRRENDFRALVDKRKQMFREIEHNLDLKRKYLELAKEKGDFEADKKLQEVKTQQDKLNAQGESLTIKEREIEILASQRKQEIYQKELNHYQEILYAFYDQFHEQNPVTLNNAFSRIGYVVDSPYRKENEHLRKQLAHERQNNLNKG